MPDEKVTVVSSIPPTFSTWSVASLALECWRVTPHINGADYMKPTGVIGFTDRSSPPYIILYMAALYLIGWTIAFISVEEFLYR